MQSAVLHGVLGKTNLHEWSQDVTGHNHGFGPSRSPFDSTRITGGPLRLGAMQLMGVRLGVPEAYFWEEFDPPVAELARDGLPAGLELTGPEGADSMLMALALGVESALPRAPVPAALQGLAGG
ncbi:hypothetical protein [Variovorax durovernensis]